MHALSIARTFLSIERLFDPSGLTPHGFCLLWEPWLIHIFATADAATGIAYFTIPVALAVYANRRADLVFRPVFWLFATFILLCGSGHWLDLLTLWVPAYRLVAVVKAATAIASALTAIAVWRLLPRALALPSPAQMRAVNETLRESEARHRANFERSPVALYTATADGIILSVNERWLTLLGYARADVEGRPLAHFLAPRPQGPDAPCRAMCDGAGEFDAMPCQFRCQNGNIIEALVSGRFERQGDSTWLVCALIDVTARRRAEAALRTSEDRLRQAQKMEAIGQLTGGIAHDFNNMLTAIMCGLELIRFRSGKSQRDITDLAGDAMKAARRAATLTAQMLSFSRRQVLDPKPLDPAVILHGMQQLFARTAGDRIDLTIESEAGAGLCVVDRNQLESAVLNLIINARDAIAARGTVRIVISSADRSQAGENDLPDGAYIRIAVIDNGRGMTNDVRAHAFEPFFTTKGVGQGSGLGLAQIHGFAHQSGGTVTIASTVGSGTEVAIYLPCAAAGENTAPPEAAAAAPPAARGCGETILLIEDIPDVRKPLSTVLRELGYRVVEAADAEMALAALEAGGAIDAVLTDISMPGSMDGLQLAHLVRARYPDLPLAVMTGFFDALRERKLPRNALFLQKPCDPAQLAETVRSALSRQTAALA